MILYALYVFLDNTPASNDYYYPAFAELDDELNQVCLSGVKKDNMQVGGLWEL